MWLARKNLELELWPREKKELSMDVDAKPYNMTPEGNNIFPRSLSVNLKEAPGIFLITLRWANKLAQMYTCSYTYITYSVKGSYYFGTQNDPKKTFYGKTIFSEKRHFSCFSSPFSGSKSWQWPKVNLGAVKQTINNALKLLLFFLHV